MRKFQEEQIKIDSALEISENTITVHISSYQVLYTNGQGKKKRLCRVILLKARLKCKQKIVLDMFFKMFTGDRKKKDRTIV